jgi:hypothetical protein
LEVSEGIGGIGYRAGLDSAKTTPPKLVKKRPSTSTKAIDFLIILYIFLFSNLILNI